MGFPFFSLVVIRLFSVVEIPIKHSSLSNKVFLTGKISAEKADN